MRYNFNDFSEAQVKLLGECIDLMPHGRVAGLAMKLQAQIFQQETAERERLALEKIAAEDAIRSDERAKVKVKSKTRPPRRKPVPPKPEG